MTGGELIIPLGMAAVAGFFLVTRVLPNLKVANSEAGRQARARALIGPYGKAPRPVKVRMSREDAAQAVLTAVRSYSGIGGVFDASSQDEGNRSLIEGQISWTENRYNRPMDGGSAQDSKLLPVVTIMKVNVVVTSIADGQAQVDWSYETVDSYGGPGTAEHLDPSVEAERICDSVNYAVLRNLKLIND